MTEPTLFDAGPPAYATDPIGIAWWAMMETHPTVGAEFVRLARQWRAANPTKPVGSKAILEVLRWNTAIGVVVDFSEPYRVNNNWSALMSRWAMDTCPDLRGAFRLRERIST